MSETKRSLTILVTLSLALSACADSGKPQASFDGEDCTYSGPDSVNASEIEVTYENSSNVASALAFIKLVDETTRADHEALVGTRRSVAGAPPPPDVELVGTIQAAPGEEATQVAPLPAGTYFVDCVTFDGEAPDEVWRVAVLEVDG